MRIDPRRALSTILAAALLLGSMPPGASAQVVRVTVGQTGGMPVSPINDSAAGTMVVPTFNIGAASLNGSFSAPSIAPSPLATNAVAPAFQPSTPNAVVAAALSGSINAAASKDAPKFTNAPKAAAPVERKTWGERFASLLSRKPAAEAPSSEAAKSGADLAFDGALEKNGSVEGPSVSGAQSASRLSGLKASIFEKYTAHQTKAAAKRAGKVDEFGGPLTEPMSFKQRVGYGLKQGLNLVGIGAILEVTLRPILDIFPWPQYLSDSVLSGLGRVALLVKYGPAEITEALANSPATFLGINLPVAVALEEFSFRLLGFGLIFLVLAAVKPFTRWISSMIDGLPNAAGAVGGAKLLLKIGDWLSRVAFPLAAALSSLSFAAAHFEAWGFSPFVLALNMSLGLFLAHTAYKSRGLTAPIIAHLVFNLVAMGAILIGLSVSPMAGGAFAIITGLLGAASLLYGWLSARKERAFRLTHGAKALAALMVVGVSLSMFSGAPVPVNQVAARAAFSQVQDRHTAVAIPLPDIIAALKGAAADTAAVESRETMVARVKGSVVNVIVKMPGGVATGSGFILTPEGVFVTNGHVVGPRQPGEFVEARVPGVPGVIKAKVLAVNHDKDLAIVQLAPRADGKPWPAVKLAEHAPREGENVTATGYPRGLPFTVTAGVVSGMDGRGNMYVKHLQTDASINPGNSGGPLFNARGEVVGVNTQIYTESGGSEGLGFSIMAPEVGRVMAQFAKTGNISTASLGIISNLSDPEAPEAGLAIEYVRHGSAAEKAGVKRGDLLIAVGEISISEGKEEAAGHVAKALSMMIPGQKTKITVLRGDSPLELELTVDAKVTSAPSH